MVWKHGQEMEGFLAFLLEAWLSLDSILLNRSKYRREGLSERR